MYFLYACNITQRGHKEDDIWSIHTYIHIHTHTHIVPR